MIHNKKYTAVVVGLGNIGMGYDYSSANDERIMTHSAAYFYHFGYELLGAVDPDAEKRALFTKKYKAPAYASVDAMFLKTPADVCSIAVPTSEHYAVFCRLLACQPKAILCEKPMTESLNQAKKMRALAKQQNVLLFVNYMRRFEPGVNKVKDLLQQGMLGKVHKVIVKYSNGFLHCATHFLDLVQYLFGKIYSMVRLNDDIDMQCRIDDIDLYFIATRVCDYALYELEVIAEKGVLNYKNAGRDIYYQLSSTDSNIDNVITLNDTPIHCPNDYNRFQWYVMDALYQSLQSGSTALSNSNIDEAIDVLGVAEQVLNEEIMQ